MPYEPSHPAPRLPCGGACKPGSHGRALAARLRRPQELSSPTYGASF